MQIRLDKYLADMGAGSRSEVKNRIRKKQVLVNGELPKGPEQKVTPGKDLVALQGKQVSYAQKEYYLFHKPAGCVSARQDGRYKTVLDYMDKKKRKDLFPVGRLDIDTEGLLLITNDGALSHRLLQPGKHVEKTYFAQVSGTVTQEDQQLFAAGIDIGDAKKTLPAELIIRQAGQESQVTVTITEGRYHQVKRMFEAVGKPVIYLKRISMGPLTLPEDLLPGAYRPLTKEEKQALQVED